MRIVVTGASGNIGTALLERLRASAAGHEVVGVCRRPPSSHPPYDVARWEPVDLADPVDVHRLGPVLQGADAVVHLAWGFQPSRDVDHLERLGVGGTRAVAAAARAAGVGHLVHMSSVGAYSPAPGGGPVTEGHPTGGVASSPYSRHKVAAERLLDDELERAGGPVQARLRPGLVPQGWAASALLRYTVPGIVPAAVLGRIPLLPMDRNLRLPVVHARDVAAAVEQVLERRAAGPFNLAADPPVTRDDIARALGARASVHLPWRALRGPAAAAWRAGLQPVDPGWLDLASRVPLLDCARARRELGWAPEVAGPAALAELVAGMTRAASTASPALRPRTVLAEVRAARRDGSVARRPLT